MSVDVYICFDGNCREAVEFYAEVFGTETPQFMTFGGAPQAPGFTMPEEVKDRIMHTRLSIEGSNVMFSDTYPGMPFTFGNNISLAIVSRSVDNIKNYFHKLKEGGTVALDLQETFWSKYYGKLTDKFGIEWQFNYESGEAGQ